MSRYHSPSAEQHRDAATGRVSCAVLTVSDTRTLTDDRSGAAIVELLQSAGHDVIGRAIIADEPTAIEEAVRMFTADENVDAVLITGGTGIAARDVTPDTICGLLTKELPGYAELFRMLSFQEIGAAAMLSRALGGLIGRKLVLLMPGSTPAVRLAMERLILPELGHLVEHARR